MGIPEYVALQEELKATEYLSEAAQGEFERRTAEALADIVDLSERSGLAEAMIIQLGIARNKGVLFEFELEAKQPIPVPIEVASDEEYEEEQPNVPQLDPRDIDIPEEPVIVEVNERVWDAAARQWVMRSLGVRTLVPTGCDAPVPARPYSTTVVLKTKLPRDQQELMNQMATAQQNGWIDRHSAMKKLNLGVTPAEVDEAILSDAGVMLALNGQPDPGQVAQTNPGTSNGAPPPPGPGPGRGNKYAPGDNMASMPPNGAAGKGV